MNAKTNLKLILDIILTVLFLILIFPKNTRFSFHEIAGLSIAALFGFHLILNWKWVKNVSKNLFSARLKARPKLYYILNIISLLCVATIIYTGIGISRVLFTSDSIVINHNCVLIHKWVSYSCLGLFAVHIALHWRFITITMRKWVNSIIRPDILKPVLGLGSVVLVFSLLYSGIIAHAQEDRLAVNTRKEPTGLQSDIYRDSPASLSENSLSGQTTPSGDNSASVSAQNSGQQITLSEFLGKMFCTGCSKHCSLLSPQCNKGYQQVEAAKTQYQQIYGQNSV